MIDTQELIKLAREPNIVEFIDSTTAAKIAEQVVEGYDNDNDSRSKWLKRATKAMEAALQVSTAKTTPWSNASNVKHPALTVAALQFQARAYPTIIKGNKVVKAMITGRDDEGQKAKQGERVAQHMNYQLLEQMPEWEEQFDKILLALPIEGCEFKKDFFDQSKGRIVSEWIRPKDFVVDNDTKSLEDCPRKTHVYERYPHQIREKMEMGVYAEHEGLFDTDDDKMETGQELLEQHFLYDLDEDGVKEPWIAVVHKEKRKLLRLVRGFELAEVVVKLGTRKMTLKELATQIGQEVGNIPPELIEHVKFARFKQENYFTKYSFIPSPEGSFYDIGFGHLIGPLMDSIDTLINQLIDSGTLNNLAGGFYSKTLRGPKGEIRLKLNEWQPIDTGMTGKVSDLFYPVPTKPPSQVLFNLVDFLLSSVSDITGVKDIMTGEVPVNTQATTALAAIEQGTQVYTSIYKRIYRCLKHEIGIIHRLNSVFLDVKEYFRVLDDNSQGVITLSDYQNDGSDITPVADPASSTKMQELAKADFLDQFVGNPAFDQDEIYRRKLDAGGILNPDNLLIPEKDRPQPPPDPVMLALAAESNAKAAAASGKAKESDAKVAKTGKEMDEIDAKIAKLYAEAADKLASAESREPGQQLDEYRVMLQELGMLNDERDRVRQAYADQQSGVQAMAGPAGNTMAVPTNGGGAQGPNVQPIVGP